MPTPIDRLNIPSIPFVNGWTRDNEIILVGRDEDGDRKFYRFDPEWYFFVRRHDALEHRPFFEECRRKGLVQRLERYHMNHEFVKVYCRNENVRKWQIERGEIDPRTIVVLGARERGIVTFEDDIDSLQRVMIDRQDDIRIAERWRTVYLDIETKDTDEAGNRVPISVGMQPILSCAFWFPDGTHKYIDGDEVGILKTIFGILDLVDIYVTFNGAGFDMPVIESRASLLNIDYSLKALTHVDFYRWFKKEHAFNPDLQSYSLNALAKHFLHEESKVTYEGTLFNLYQTDRERFRLYNLQDVRLLWQLNQKERVIPQIRARSQIGGVFPSRYIGTLKGPGGFYPSVLIDGYNLKRGHVTGTPLPSPVPATKTAKYRGAHVDEPRLGAYRNVVVLDFKSMHPSIIRTWNIGPDTLTTSPGKNRTVSPLSVVEQMGLSTPAEIQAGHRNEKVYFHLDSPSIIAEAATIFLEQRAICRAKQKPLDAESEEWKRLDVEQAAWKIMANSCYGITGSPDSRYHDRRVAESITIGSRAIWFLTRQWFEAHGCLVVYGDTDSIFVALQGNDPAELLRNFHRDFPGILKERFRCPKSYIVLELEEGKQFQSMFFAAKKCYGGIGHDGKFAGKGLDFTKRATARIAAELHEHLCLEIARNPERDAEVYADWLKGLKQRILVDPIPAEDLEKFCIWKKVSGVYDPRRAVPLHAEVFRDMKKAGDETMIGMSVPVIRVIPDGTRQGKTDGLHIDHFKRSNRQIDREFYWNTEILSRLIRILRAVYPQYDWMRFNTEEIEKRKKLIGVWRKDIRSHKKFKAVEHAIATTPWVTATMRAKILAGFTADDRVILQEALTGAIAKRCKKFQDQEVRPDVSCPKCDMDPPLTLLGTLTGTKHVRTKAMCLNCSYEWQASRDP